MSNETTIAHVSMVGTFIIGSTQTDTQTTLYLFGGGDNNFAVELGLDEHGVRTQMRALTPEDTITGKSPDYVGGRILGVSSEVKPNAVGIELSNGQTYRFYPEEGKVLMEVFATPDHPEYESDYDDEDDE